MKKALLIFAGAVVIAIVLTVLYLVLHKGTTQTPVGGNPFNFASSTGSTNEQFLVLSDGTNAKVPDFLPKTQPDWASPAYGYQVTQDDTKPYAILFYPNDSSFLISLTSEPLGEARFQAQAILQSQLKLDRDQMCKLKVQVFTSISVSESYSGQNLGLSYCPGATQLPI